MPTTAPRQAFTAEEKAFMEAAENLNSVGGNLRDLASLGLSESLGIASAEALEFYLGDEAFTRPFLFVQKLEELFGKGSFVLLGQLTELAQDRKGGMR